MEEKVKNIYNQLTVVDRLSKEMYNDLVSIYGTEIVHLVIEDMIDQDKNNIYKFEYYIEKMTIDFGNFSDKSILEIYIQDIGGLPRLSHEENFMLASEAHIIVKEMRTIFDGFNNKYVRKLGVVFNSIVDEFEFYINECTDEKDLIKLRNLYNRFIDIRNKLVEGNVRVVVAATKKYFKDDKTFMEIIQFGNMGLMRTVEKYDPSFNVKFITYAYYWIRQTVRNAIKSEFTTATSISYNAMTKNNSRIKAENILTNKLGRNPTEEEIASYMGVNSQKLEEIEVAFARSVPLSTNIFKYYDNAEDITYADMVEDISVDVENDAFLNILRLELFEAMDQCLTKKSKQMLLMRFGFYGDIFSFKQIGDAFGDSKQNVEQTVKRSLVKVKRVAGDNLKDFL